MVAPRGDDADAVAESGYGMWLIATESKDWGCDRMRHGKEVWFLLDLFGGTAA